MSRPIRELQVSQLHPRMIEHRDSYNGMWMSSIVTPKGRLRHHKTVLQPNEFFFPIRAYHGKNH